MTIFQTLLNNKKETFPNWSQVQRLLERKSLDEIRCYSHENKVSQASIEAAEELLQEVENEEQGNDGAAADVFLEWVHATVYHQKLMAQVIYMQEYRITVENRLQINEQYLEQQGWEEGHPIYIPPEVNTPGKFEGVSVQHTPVSVKSRQKSVGSPAPIVQEAFLEEKVATQIEKNIDQRTKQAVKFSVQQIQDEIKAKMVQNKVNCLDNVAEIFRQTRDPRIGHWKNQKFIYKE